MQTPAKLKVKSLFVRSGLKPTGGTSHLLKFHYPFSYIRFFSDDLALNRLRLFKQRLTDINNTSKWYFDDASVAVEDRLAEYVYNNNESETPAHSFVLDTGDPDVEKLFTPEEWVKIKEQLPQPSDPDTVLKDYLDFFRNVSSQYILNSNTIHLFSHNHFVEKNRR